MLEVTDHTRALNNNQEGLNSFIIHGIMNFIGSILLHCVEVLIFFHYSYFSIWVDLLSLVTLQCNMLLIPQSSPVCLFFSNLHAILI